MDINTTQTTADAASVVNPIDDIASLLMGEEEETSTEAEGQEEEAAEGQAEPSTGEGEESGEGEPEEEQSEEELTWDKALGVDPNQLVLDEEGNLKGVNVKVDGEVSTVSVKDLISGYQLNKHVTQRSQALAEERKEFDALRSTAATAYHEKLQTADKLLEIMDQGLMKEFSAINWEQLRTQNPGEFAALQTEFNSRKAQLQQVYAAVKAEQQELQGEYQKENQKRYQEFVQGQFQKVLENNPQWADKSKMQADIAEMGQFAGSYGITADEFNMLSDARYVEILKDAMAYRKGKTVTQQKVQNVPKLQKAGKTSKPMSKLTQLTLNARKAKGHAARDMQAAAVAELLMGG